MDVTTLNPIWLRDNCPCPECRHESGQRLLDTRTIPDDLTVTWTSENEARFSDGHASTFDPAWLTAHAGPPPARARRLWDASIQESLPRMAYADVAQGGAPLREWLAAVDELGFAILSD